MWLLNIKKSDKPEKKMKATFCLCAKKNECKGTNHKEVHFGAKGSETYLDHKDETKRENYLKRHKANEDWNKPTTAGSLSRWILWGPFTSLSKNIEYFKKKFKL
jgi:hypothetical protein